MTIIITAAKNVNPIAIPLLSEAICVSSLGALA
jgi:hypothetical protein